MKPQYIPEQIGGQFNVKVETELFIVNIYKEYIKI